MILREEFDNSLKKEIIADLFIALKRANTENLCRMEEDIEMSGNHYDFLLSYEVTGRPTYTVHQFDYDSEPEWETIENTSFEITQLNAYSKETEEEVCDVLKILSRNEYEEVKKYLDFDLSEIGDNFYYEKEFDYDDIFENRIKLTENDIASLVKRVINEVASKRTIINRIYKVTHELTSKIYRNDDYWNGPRMIVNAIKSLGYEVGLGAKDGGYRKSSDGMSQWKEYQIDIDTPEGFNIQGTLNCHAAGSMEDPFDRYDMSLVMW